MKLQAQQFRNLISNVQDALNSLVGCLTREVPNEARGLRRVMAELQAATLVRHNPDLVERQASLLRRCQETLTTREARFEASQPRSFTPAPASPPDYIDMGGGRMISWERWMSE